MITMKNLQVEDIKDEWLYNALTQGIKECITAPVLTLNPTKPEPIKRAEMILENFSQEDSPVVATKLKQAIHEVFENEKKKGGLMYKEPSLEPMESSIIREALYLLTPQLP